MEKLQKEKYYKITLNIFGRILTYAGKVTYLENEEFGLKTQEESCPLQFKTKDILSIEKTSPQKQKEKIFKLNSKKQFKNLKPSEKPRGL